MKVKHGDRHPDVAIYDIMENIHRVHYRHVPPYTDIGDLYGLDIWTNTELYTLYHGSRLISRTIGIADGRYIVADTHTLSIIDYNKILTAVEDHLNMAVYDFSFGTIEFAYEEV
jgi:hypothetical protein